MLERLKRRMGTLRVGDPLDKNTDIGAINSAEQLARIRELSDIGEAEGAGRWSPACDLPSQGFWFPPTIFTGVSQAHRIAREEIFGPVVSVIPFDTDEEGLRLANATPYGLSGSIWSRDIGKALRAANALQAGVISVNTNSSVHTEAPFGGYKMSGIGRELGMSALDLFTEVKNVFVDLT